MIKNSVKIIAEAGVNHNGSLKEAKKLIDCASKAGADYVKFQTFSAEDLATKLAPKASYQKRGSKKKETQYEMLKKLELKKSDYLLLKKYCKKKKINFLSSPFSIKSFDLLNKIGLKEIKIPSGEIDNYPLLKHIGKYNKKIILSSGISTLEEVSRAVKILNKAGTQKNKITVLHCNSEYPTPFENVNLKAMNTIKYKLGVKVGYSDHTLGYIVPIAAVALGASIIEKHFTLNKKSRGPDHKASLNSLELKEMIKKIKNTEKILGSYIKKPSKGELKNKKVVRKSIVAKTEIKKGDVFSNKNISTKRPAIGLSPKNWSKIVGKKSKYNFRIDQPIKI
mgnify:CR=1 FL=1